jgi:predicted transcriptional regulator
MKKYAFTEFRDKVKKALQGEKAGLTWSQLRAKGEIVQARMCYTWAKELENDIGLIRERRGRRVYWKLKR